MPKKPPPKIVPSNIIRRSNLPDKVDFFEGLLLLIDKPKDWTSFDVVNKLRFAIKHKLHIKKIKVGHAGTLDPMATGLLLVCVGKYTKSIDILTSEYKTYIATLRLGATTPSYDAESEIDAQYPTAHLNEKMLYEGLSAFTGEITQIPPMYSAIKIKGQKLYDLARKGKTIERKPRNIHIKQLRIDRILPFEEIDLYVSCSKGTYIRSLGHDYAQSLGTGGYLTALRRLSIGPYHVDDALTIRDAIRWIDKVEV